MKKFKSHNQQLKELRDKGLIIGNASKAKRVLEVENYYSVINGYRELFALSTRPFRFMSGTTFDEVFSLYELDRELRNVYLKYLLKVEKSLQSLTAYYFSNNHQNNNRAYLNFHNFRIPSSSDRGLPSRNEIHRTISMFASKMSNNYDHTLQHYITNHQEIPFWVLVNTLTMGEIAYVYYFIQDSDRTTIATYFTNQRRKEYNDASIMITSNDVDKFLFSAKHFRNACAHNERFFCKANSQIQSIKILRDKMKNYLTKKDMMNFERQLSRTFSDFEPRFVTIPLATIKNRAGF
ncbi:MAG: Abi family protein [Acholeplasma sp.]|jgi:abortive infection bacteriophage resistance protein|nr:Abi family protein [Acholeplasma sp.]